MRQISQNILISQEKQEKINFYVQYPDYPDFKMLEINTIKNL